MINGIWQTIEFIRWKMRGLWGYLVITLILFIYSLSTLPAHQWMAYIVFLPLLFGWQQRLKNVINGQIDREQVFKSENSKLRTENIQFRSEKADLGNTNATLEAENTGFNVKIDTLTRDVDNLKICHEKLTVERNQLAEQNSVLENNKIKLEQAVIDLEAEKSELETKNGLKAVYLNALLASSTDGQALADTQGKIIYANAEFSKMVGKSVRGIIGTNYESVIKNESLRKGVREVLINKPRTAIDTFAPVFEQLPYASIYTLNDDICFLGVLIILHQPEPASYFNRNSPLPRPRSTVSLSDVFGWFFPPEIFQPAYPYVNIVAHKCRNDPSYAGSHGLTGPAEPETGRLLYAIIRLLKPENVIEVGSYNGASSICMAQALVDNNSSNGLLYSIDVDTEHLKLATRHLREAGLEAKVLFHHGRSDDPGIVHALPKSEVIFVDGDHTYEGAKKDFDIYKNLLVDQGIIIFHDTIKIMDLQRLMCEIAQSPEYDTFTVSTSDGDGITLIRRT